MREIVRVCECVCSVCVCVCVCVCVHVYTCRCVCVCVRSPLCLSLSLCQAMSSGKVVSSIADHSWRLSETGPKLSSQVEQGWGESPVGSSPWKRGRWSVRFRQIPPTPTPRVEYVVVVYCLFVVYCCLLLSDHQSGGAGMVSKLRLQNCPGN